MQLDAEVTVIERGVERAVARIVRHDSDVVAEETGPRDLPTAGSALESEQALTCRDVASWHD